MSTQHLALKELNSVMGKDKFVSDGRQARDRKLYLEGKLYCREGCSIEEASVNYVDPRDIKCIEMGWQAEKAGE